MANTFIDTISRIPEWIIVAIVGILTAYWQLRGRYRESQAEERIAAIQAGEDPADLAESTVETQRSIMEAYRQLVNDLTEPMQRQEEKIALLQSQLAAANERIVELESAAANVDRLRGELASASEKIQRLEKKVDDLEGENLRTKKELERAKAAESRLRERLAVIRAKLKDTGELDSGKHKTGGKDG